MPRFIQAAKAPKRKAPAFLEAARAFYGDAFGVGDKKALAESMAEWGDLSDEEQSFALAHLQYLNLLAQAANLRMLADLRELLDEVAEALQDALEAGAEDAPRREPGGDEDEDDERDVFVDDGEGEEAPAAEDESAPAPTPATAPEAPAAEPGGGA